MSQLPTCVQCGSKEFFIESGFYFCAECQIQSQDIREQVLLQNYGGSTQVRLTNIATPSENKPGKRKLPEGPELTSWEVLNYILKGWVDELIRLGVDTRLKVVALQLWVTYLGKLEVAFTSSVVQKRPRLGFTFKTRDAQLIYGASDTQAKVIKNPFSSRSSASSQTSASTSTTAYGLSRIRSKKRKELASALYEEESVVSDTSRCNVSLDNLSASSPGSTKTTKMCYTVHAKKTLTKLFGSLDSLPDAELQETTFRKAQVSEMKSVRHMNVLNVFSILRLALLIIKSPVQLSDMFRWSREGYLSLRDLERLLPSSVNVTKDIKSLLINPLNSWASVTKKLYHMTLYLGIENVNIDLWMIIEKLALELYLPDDIMEIIRKLFCLSRPTATLSSSVNYEGRAVSFIIFVLKCVFSLDGRTEIFNSRAARLINAGLDKKRSEEKRLFVWTEWTESMEFRDAVISKYHVPSREKWYPGADLHGTAQNFLGQWSIAPKRQIVQRVKEVNGVVANALDHILGPLCCGGNKPPRPSLNPSVTLIEDVAPLEESSVRTPLISLLDISSKSSLFVYFDVERLTSLAEENDCTISYDVPVELRNVSKYRCGLIRPRSKALHEMVSVELCGDVSWSEESDDGRSLSSEDVDDPDYKPSKSKMTNIKSKSKENFEISSDDNDEETVEKSYSRMSVMSGRDGNIASKIDLVEIATEGRTDSDESALYLTHNSYWRLEGSFHADSITIEEFEELARGSMSPSFFWLLSRCSKLIDQSMRDVYKQFLIVENVYIANRKW